MLSIKPLGKRDMTKDEFCSDSISFANTTEANSFLNEYGVSVLARSRSIGWTA
jgi:hypothetical protein